MNNEVETKEKSQAKEAVNNLGVEGLLIYKQYLDLIYYTLSLLVKYPKSERFGLNSDIRKATYDGLECILYAYRLYDKKEKLHYLFELDIKLKLIKVLARVSYKKEYINAKNYGAWSRKLFHIGNMLGGWISSCQKG